MMQLLPFRESAVPEPENRSIHRKMLREARSMARMAVLFAVPILGFFIFQDLMITRNPANACARSASLGLFVLAGMLAWLPVHGDRPASIILGIALASLVAMSCHMVYLSCYATAGMENERIKAIASLTYTLLVVLLFSGGLRPWIFLISGLPVLALGLALGMKGVEPASDWSLFFNPLAIFLITVGLGLVQHRNKINEIRNRDLVNLRDRQLEGLLDCIDETAFLLDKDGTVVLCNQKLASRLGHEKQEITGRPISGFLPAELGRKRMEELKKALASGKPGRYQDTDGKRHIAHTLCPVSDGSGGFSHLAVFAKDVTEQVMREEELVWQALHDPLTGLLNRRSLMPRLDQAVKRARRGFCSALLIIDLDGFKAVNDCYGHKAGDSILRKVAGILEHGERDHDAAFRIGGDEFALLLEDLGLGEACQVATRMLQLLGQTCDEVSAADKASGPMQIGASMGLGLIDGRLDSATLMERCDAAMYRAKLAGKNQVMLADNGDKSTEPLVRDEENPE